MKKEACWIFGFLFLFGCQKKTNNAEIIVSRDASSFEMYQMSEMATLMEQIYADNQRIKQKIEENEFDFGKFPEYYSKLYTATFTDPSDLDDFYLEETKKFLKLQKLIYADTTNLKTNFNSVVTACIECHNVKCALAIERIKKLYIK